MKARKLLCILDAVILRHLVLFPLAVLYGAIIRLRNLLFDTGVFKESEYPVRIIAVGNLVAGGSGKTPHVEYLIRLLRSKYSLATLSRGYGRKTKGYYLAGDDDDHLSIGDEPLQYTRKFDDIIVAVDEKRNNGIANLCSLEDAPEIILLDDAFQHRWVKPGLNILLTDFHSVYVHDFILPAGYLREPASGAKRADIIIVTKTPEIFSPITRRRLIEEIKPLPKQKVFFSYISYDDPIPLTESARGLTPQNLTAAFLFAGIANPYPLEDYLRRKYTEVVTMKFADHHIYTENDLKNIRSVYSDHLVRKKILITTEKDAMRLSSSNLLSLLEDIPLAYIPIRIKFHDNDGQAFDEQILAYVEQNKSDR